MMPIVNAKSFLKSKKRTTEIRNSGSPEYSEKTAKD
jgi:hypothetical protein